MKAAIVNTHKGKFSIETVPIPVPSNSDILVKIHASGCCHTDVHAIDGDWPVKSKLPLCPGHEGAGIVVALGPLCTSHKIGDRVGVAWLHDSCGLCEHCVEGWETLCEKQHNTGYSVDGCLAEYTIAKDTHAIKLPSTLSFEQAAPILCAGVTTYKALKETEAKPGQFVTIIGAAGGLGHLAVQYAKAMGLRVIAMDVGEEKLKFCLELGADFVVSAMAPDAAAQVVTITSGGSHGVCVFASQASAFKAAIDMCRRKGTVVCCGLPAGTFPVPIFDMVLKRITIRGSIVGTRQDMVEALDFASRGLVKCTVHMDTLENINTVFDHLRKGEIEGRVVIQM